MSKARAMNSDRNFLAAMFGAAACALAPAGAAAQSLEDALSVAYSTNPTIRAERARLRATSELKAQAWAGALPTISAGGSWTNIDQTQTINSEVFGGVGATEEEFSLNTLAAEVTAEQPVFTGFRNLNAIRQARARVRAGGAELAATEQAVLQSVAGAYFDVLRDQTIFEANRNQVSVLGRQLDEANARFRVGEVTRTDVSQAEARLAGARANLSAAQAALAVSRASYIELVGEAPGTLDPEPPLPSLPETPDSAQALALEYAPAIVAARATADAARRQVAIAKGAFLPSVSLTAGYSYAEEPSSFTLNDEQYTYGARASVPIFSGGLRLSQVREARANAERARHAIDEAERRAAAQVTGAWEQLYAARATIEAARAQVDANRIALDGVRREAQLGARSTLDVLDAEQELLDAEVQLARAERDERTASYALLAAAGLLTLEAAIGVETAMIIPAED